jgi:prepilin signal peptidase PulO-like enzyme (type II secretory pathway)
MQQPFFSEPLFGWLFVGALMGLLALAAVVDIRTARIPKSITLTTAACGLLANIARGALLGLQGKECWHLGLGSVWLGAADGLLFAVAGLFFGFIVFTGMYLLGSCGGGDVKLCAAIGAWIGAFYTVFLLMTSVGVLVLWIGGKIALGGAPALGRMRKDQEQVKGNRPKGLPANRITFSLPAAVSAALVMLWFFRFDLQLDTPPAPEQEAKHASGVATNL